MVRLAFSIGLALWAAAAAQAASPAPQEIITQSEYDIGRAYVRRDVTIIDRVFADDFTSYSDSAKNRGKAAWKQSVMNPKLVITMFRYAPFSIHVIGKMAYVQGENEDNAKYEGKDISGLYTWLDIFEQRGGKWVLVANETAPVADRKDKWGGPLVTITQA